MKLETIQTKVTGIQAANKAAADALQEQINKAAQDKAEATGKLLQAQETGTPEDYAAAAAEVRTRADILELYTRKKTKLETSPKVTPDDYAAMKTATIAALDDASAAAGAKIDKAMKDLEAIREELAPIMEHGRALLLQIDLLNAPGSTPTSTYNEQGPDGGRSNKVAVIDSILDNHSVKYIRGI